MYTITGAAKVDKVAIHALKVGFAAQAVTEFTIGASGDVCIEVAFNTSRTQRYFIIADIRGHTILLVTTTDVVNDRFRIQFVLVCRTLDSSLQVPHWE